MDASRYRIREYRAEDLASITRLQNRVDPKNAHSVQEQEQFEKAFHRPDLLDLRWVVEDTRNGELVGAAYLEQHPFNFHPGKAWTDVEVDPSHRRCGLGTALARRLEEEARTHGIGTLWTSVEQGDPVSVRFFEAYGFRVIRSVWLSWLDLPTARLDAFPQRGPQLAAEGIRFTSLAEEGPANADVRRRYYDLYRITGLDVPSMDEPTEMPYDQFVRFELERDAVLPEGTFLAAHGDLYVGVTTLERMGEDPQGVTVGYTGVRREYRGRGIAAELKLRAIRFARDRGYRRMRTGNDSLNRPIWSINDRLGFRPRQTWLNGERALQTPAPR